MCVNITKHYPLVAIAVTLHLIEEKIKKSEADAVKSSTLTKTTSNNMNVTVPACLVFCLMSLDAALLIDSDQTATVIPSTLVSLSLIIIIIMFKP